MTKQITIVVRCAEERPHPQTVRGMLFVLDSAVSVAQEEAKLLPGVTVEVITRAKS